MRLRESIASYRLVYNGQCVEIFIAHAHGRDNNVLSTSGLHMTVLYLEYGSYPESV